MFQKEFLKGNLIKNFFFGIFIVFWFFGFLGMGLGSAGGGFLEYPIYWSIMTFFYWPLFFIFSIGSLLRPIA